MNFGLKLLTNLSRLFTKLCVLFTILVLAFTLILYAPVDNEAAKYLAPKADMILSILLFSFIYSLTEIFCDNWKAGDTARRIVHFLLNFVNLWVSFFLVIGRVKQVKEFIIMGFLFMIFYVLARAISAGFKKIKEKLE